MFHSSSDALNSWKWVADNQGGDYVRAHNQAAQAAQGSGYADHAENPSDFVGSMREIYTPDRFHSHAVKFCGWYGRHKGFPSLEIAEKPENFQQDFRNMCDVLHRRLFDGYLGPVFDKVGRHMSEDAVIVLAAAVPLGVGVYQDMQNQRKNQRMKK